MTGGETRYRPESLSRDMGSVRVGISETRCIASQPKFREWDSRLPNFLSNVLVLISHFKVPASWILCADGELGPTLSITDSLHELHKDWSEKAERLMEMSWCLQSPVQNTHRLTADFNLTKNNYKERLTTLCLTLRKFNRCKCSPLCSQCK